MQNEKDPEITLDTGHAGEGWSLRQALPNKMVLVLHGPDGKPFEMLRFEPNGDIYVKGRLVENDMEVVNGMRELLASRR